MVARAQTRDKERARYRFRSGSAPTQPRKPAGHDKAFGIAAHWMDHLGVTSACGTCARNRSRLRGSRLTNRRNGLAALRRDSRSRCFLSCTPRRLAAGHVVVPSSPWWVAQVTGLPGPIKPVKAPRLPRGSAPEDGSERPAEPSPTDSPAYLRDLNVAQRAAVEHAVSDAGSAEIPGPLLIIAGAGTGKTSTLAHRVAHLRL